MLPPWVAPARALAASRRRPSARASWRSASQSRTGRDRQAAVGIRDGGNRQQRLPARKASRKWNSTAVSQRRGSAWARSRRLHFEFGLR